MKHILRTITATAAALTACISIFARGDSGWDKEARMRKAEYIYGEAQRRNALGDKGATYELYRRAYEIDSTNSDYYSELGLNYVMMVTRDESLMHEGIDLMRKKFDADPTDYTNAYYYSQLLANTGQQARQIEVLHIVDSLNPTRADIALTYIDALLSSEDSTHILAAEQRLDRLAVTAGQSMELTRRKTAGYALLNDTVKALREIHRAIDASPLNPECYSFAGRYFEVQGALDSARIYYMKACDIEPENGAAAYQLAQFYKNSGDTIGYSKEIDRTLLETDLDINDKHQILLDYTSDLYRDSAYYPQVNTIFDRVIEKNPQAAEIRDLYAQFLSVQKNYGAAAEQMELVLDLQPEEVENWIRAGILYSQKGDNPRAVTTLERALKYHDTNADLHRVLSSALFLADSDNNIDRAISEMNRAFELTDSTNTTLRSEYLAGIGDYYFSAEKPDSAEIYYLKALEINPGNIMAKNNYAYHVSESTNDTERLAKAERLSYDTVTSEPQNPVYLDTYAWILFKMQDYKKAKEYIDRAFSHESEDGSEPSSEYYEHAGDIYFWNQLPGEAVEFWQKALDLDPDNELLARKVKYKTYFHE